jgi:16S rRNA processing protein RimM
MDHGRIVTLGEITKPQGMKGEVRVNLFGGSVDVLERLQKMSAVRQGAPPRALSLESVRTQGRVVVLKFAEVTDRTAAENLVGWELQIPAGEMPELPSGEYYTFELEGLEIITESGDRLGILEEVLDLPAHDVYVVREGEREILLPATEEVVKEVDLDRRRMVVHLIAGLED